MLSESILIDSFSIQMDTHLDFFRESILLMGWFSTVHFDFQLIN